MKKVIILIPVFNDWDSLDKLLIEIEKNIKDLPELIIECYVVNDASTIPSPKLKKPDIFKTLKILNMKANKGQQDAMLLGLDI